eukprot:CAMPEP_0119361034 /NCGR_PEP_ID=MMETSP1334-20130426/8460_1 /TAXON_ID=127549 /ORGANISM="Calcidiscus leptoporus, Strain RCC1130" /LENGTH=70 /DNA_ID=CAMNT_0007375961 /DNA_START=127 /DNA_END=339 /DNA_ORIENTATION=+
MQHLQQLRAPTATSSAQKPEAPTTTSPCFSSLALSPADRSLIVPHATVALQHPAMLNVLRELHRVTLLHG